VTDPTQEPLSERLDAALAKLPRGHRKIADYLEREGITGVVQMACACPLARWLRKELEIPLVEVGGNIIFAYTISGETIWREPSRIVERFVVEFDRGAFPTLIDEGGMTREEQWTAEEGGLEAL
jgi:hypothetical protein